VLVLDMIETLPPLGKYKYDTWRIVPVKCYIDNSVCLRSCIRNINNVSNKFGILHVGTCNNKLLIKREMCLLHFLTHKWQ
jgi:hypothetical protein